MLRRQRLRAAQQEHHVRVMGGAGPYFLSVDDPIAVLQFGLGLRIGQIAAVARLRIPLAPDDIAADRRSDIFALLLIGPDLQQSRHKHRDALIGQSRIDIRSGKLPSDDRCLHDVRLLAGAPVFLGDGAPDIAMGQEALLPVQRLLVRPLPPAADLGRQMPVLGYKGADFCL